MSKFVKIRTELRDLNLIQRALDDLKIEYLPDQIFVHRFSGRQEQAALVVKSGQVQFGLRADDGHYEVMADDMQMPRIKPILAQMTQRYAYHKVLADASLAGFELVEESVGKDNVIRLTVRRWTEGG